MPSVKNVFGGLYVIRSEFRLDVVDSIEPSISDVDIRSISWFCTEPRCPILILLTRTTNPKHCVMTKQKDT